jgi:hypothetical protein
VPNEAKMNGRFTVWFTNMTGCALGVSDISWTVSVTAASQGEAIELAVKQALAVNREFGMPPHGLRIDDAELRQLAFVLPNEDK